MYSRRIGYAVIYVVLATVVSHPPGAQAKTLLISSLTRSAQVNDPGTWIQKQLAPSNGTAFEGFGGASAVSPETVFVGATRADINGNSDQGAVYAYTFSNQHWEYNQELISSDGAASDAFGNAMTIDGNIALIGAFRKTVNGTQLQGMVYAFAKNNAGNWVQTQEFTGPNIIFGEKFGSSISISGNTAVIGSAGAAYTYTNQNGTWVFQQELTGSNGAIGPAAVIYGNQIFVGAPEADVNGTISAGEVYVYTLTNGVWKNTQILTSQTVAENANFGGTISVSDGTMVIGAPNQTVNGKMFAGAAYVFSDDNGNWVQQTELNDPDTSLVANSFGMSLAIYGASMMISEANGEVFLYSKSSGNGSWQYESKLTPYDASSGNGGYGSEIEIGNNVAMIGAPVMTTNGIQQEGAAYLLEKRNITAALSAPSSVGLNQVYTTRLILTNNSATQTAPVSVSLSFSGSGTSAGTSYVSASTAKGSCIKVQNQPTVNCDVGPIAGNGGTAEAGIDVKSEQVIPETISITGAVINASPPLTTQQATVASSSPSSLGGGGSVGLSMLAILALVWTLCSPVRIPINRH